jgi:hypothetical protein
MQAVQASTCSLMKSQADKVSVINQVNRPLNAMFIKMAN